MRSPRLIVVTGSESSGTRLVARIASLATGWTMDDMTDLWNRIAKPTLPSGRNLVTRRSMPHGHRNFKRKFFNTNQFHQDAKENGWDPFWLLTTRDPTICAWSKSNVHLAGDYGKALAEVQRSEKMIGEHIHSGLPYEIISFESLIVCGPVLVTHALRNLGILVSDRSVESYKIRNENLKYFGEPVKVHG